MTIFVDIEPKDLDLIPKYAHSTDSGVDLRANVTEPVVIQPGETKLVDTGIKIKLPPATEAQVRPRSGLALKHSITVLNTPGTVDEGFSNYIGVILINHGKEPFTVNRGDKIAQLVFAPVYKANLTVNKVETNTPRGEKGFGSTGVR